MSIINLPLCKEGESGIKTVGSELRQLPAAALPPAKGIMAFSGNKWDNMLYLRIFFPKVSYLLYQHVFICTSLYAQMIMS